MVIVDDSDLIQQRLVSLLKPMAGVTVAGRARNMVEGETVIRDQAPDLVILDVNLGGENGLNLLKPIKEGPDPPMVLVFTNYPYPAFRTYSRDLGAEHFLTKSGDFHRIPGIIKDFAAEGTPGAADPPRQTSSRKKRRGPPEEEG